MLSPAPAGTTDVRDLLDPSCIETQFSILHWTWHVVKQRPTSRSRRGQSVGVVTGVMRRYPQPDDE